MAMKYYWIHNLSIWDVYSCSNETVSRKTSMESVTSNDSMLSEMSTTSDVVITDVVKSSSSATRAGDPKSVSVQDPVNNNSLPHEISHEELELLKKLEEQNRWVNYFLLWTILIHLRWKIPHAWWGPSSSPNLVPTPSRTPSSHPGQNVLSISSGIIKDDRSYDDG